MFRFILISALLAAPAIAAEDGAKWRQNTTVWPVIQWIKKLLDPAYKDVVAYKGQKDAEAMLMGEIRKGLPGGKWGQIPMPAQQINDKDLRVIVRWVLAQ